MTVAFHLSSCVRALGPATAASLPSSTPARTAVRAGILGVTDLAARRIDPRGITLVSVTPDAPATFTPLQQFASQALTTGTWVAVFMMKGLVTDRLPIPRRVTVLATGVAVYFLDTLSIQRYDELMRRVESVKQQAKTANGAS